MMQVMNRRKSKPARGQGPFAARNARVGGTSAPSGQRRNEARKVERMRELEVMLNLSAELT